MKRLLVALVFLTLLIAFAAPSLADDGTAPERQAPGWHELVTSISPPPRANHPMAYDLERQVVTVFGGYDSTGTVLGDLWELSSHTLEWTQRQHDPSPPPRSGSALVYDEARQQMLLIGGYNINTNTAYNDVWRLDEAGWTEVVSEISPSPRWLAAVAYDPQRQVVHLYGGEEPGIGMHDDWWTWDGSNWQEQVAATPPERAGAAIAYDRRREVLMLFGGLDFFNVRNDLWELNSEGVWQEVTPSPNPSPRERAEAVFFPRSRRLFMYGGEMFTYYDDVFLWSGQSWATREFNPTPAGRCCFGMVYDPVLKGIIVFGGSVSWISSNDLWLFK